ncbi:NADH dehydrogenase [ubiquinone] 1 alpha subcomplex subunit 2-like, partial [Hippocampus comes]|uniref:NADH dehydrogenase [ubiquinone] 1 alpha subcomplex subunit 2-like n=1 Tax=Hippocampus comes TaxID=109280 RepID=UPI00094F004F
MAAAVVRGLGSALAKNLREIRIHVCQTSAASKGTRDFVEQHYVDLKRANADFPILVRECSGVEARLWARYGEWQQGIMGDKMCMTTQVALKQRSQTLVLDGLFLAVMSTSTPP